MSTETRAVCLTCPEETIQEAVRDVLTKLGCTEASCLIHHEHFVGSDFAGVDRATKAAEDHGASELIVVEHEDCAEYAQRLGSDTRNDHIRGLNRAGLRVRRTHPNLEAHLYLLSKGPNGKWEAEEIGLELSMVLGGEASHVAAFQPD